MGLLDSNPYDKFDGGSEPHYGWLYDAPLNSSIDAIASPKVKTTEGQGVGAHSLAHDILGVEGRVRTLGWGLRQLTSRSIIHMDLHKPNNKLVSA